MSDHIIRVTDPCRPLEFDLSRPLEIEVGCGKGKFLAARAAEIAAAFKELGFAYVTLDLRGYRTGSMNEVLTDEI